MPALRQTFGRRPLRRAAIRYAEHGWHVMPGAVLPPRRIGRNAKERRFDCGQPGCRTVACHPALPGWETRASDDPAMVDAWWQVSPYTVLLATGHAFDVLEVPAALGRAALSGDGSVAARGPVAVAPGGRWMFWVRPGHAVLPELAEHQNLVLHGPDSWVPAPPSPQFGGRVRWVLSPTRHQWRPAEPYVLQVLMADALRAGQLRKPAARAVQTYRTTGLPPVALRHENFTCRIHADAQVSVGVALGRDHVRPTCYSSNG